MKMSIHSTSFKKLVSYFAKQFQYLALNMAGHHFVDWDYYIPFFLSVVLQAEKTSCSSNSTSHLRQHLEL